MLPLASMVEGFTMVMGRDKAEITGGTFLGKKARKRVSMITVKKKKRKVAGY